MPDGFILGLRKKIEDNLRPFLGKKRCLLTMYPAHMNGGDGLMWLGLQELFKTLNTEIALSLPNSWYDEALMKSLDYDTILLFGGGNFGDIWPGFNEYRCRLISAFRHKAIVQLPNTIKYYEKENLRKMKEAIKGHPDFILTVRDQTSYELAKKEFDCQIYLIPDLAFYVDPGMFIKHQNDFAANAKKEILYFLRTDRESSLREEAPIHSRDWQDFLPVFFKFKEQIFKKVFYRNYFKFFPGNKIANSAAQKTKIKFFKLIEEYYKKMFKIEIKKVLREMSQYKLIVTDRLHVHLLSALCNKPNRLLNNSYHKNSSFYDTWTREDGVSEMRARL